MTAKLFQLESLRGAPGSGSDRTHCGQIMSLILLILFTPSDLPRATGAT
ncbi:MAG: hypothetical protein Q8S27_12120 [Hoeflea sp.]|nr:hypothetical protein [Hoeflea sp.]MDP2120834.1 hypothetical protein [Hoeflea sp.]MDP3525318.1 hypothetical protein [Hoeflea sp.]MDZ7601061.1 hypothetical protein [Hoeflea sp.]